MKKSIKYIFNTLLLASCFTFFSCNNIFQNDEKLQSENTLSSVNRVKITATVDLGTNSRKAVPEDYSLYDRLNYVLKATCNSDDSFSTEVPFDESEIELELVAANWSFELTAFDAGNTPILRSSENTNIDITEDTELNFKMIGLANGVLEYEFNLGSIAGDGEEPYKNPELKYIVYKYSKPLLEENKIALTVENFQNNLSREVTEENGKTSTSFTRKVTISLPEGTYLVICEKESEDNPEEFNFFFQELVEIKAGLTTTSEYKNINSASPEYKITFHTNGGEIADAYYLEYVSEGIYKSSVGSGKITYNAAFPTPIRQDCVFAGWYYDSAFTNPVTYDFAYRFDLPDTEANNVYFLGNCDVYAKWEMVTFPEILLYESNKGNSSKKPVVTNNWSLQLETNYNDDNTYFYTHAINVGNDVYGIYQYYNNEYKSVVLNNSEPMIDATKFSGKKPKKIAYDSVTNKIVILLTSNQDGTDEYSFMTCNPDGTGLTSIEYSTEDKSRLKESLSSEAEQYAFAVHNNKVYFSFYQFNANNPDQQYSKLYVSNIGGSVASLIEIQDISDFIGSSLDGMEEFIQSAQISDIVFASDDAIYASVIVGSDGMISDNLVHFGLIVKVDPSTYTATPLFNYNPLNTKTLTSSNYGNDIQANYYGINGLGDKSCLAGPTRILAIKEDELILVDEGVYMWSSNINKGYYADVNRIVVFDLAKNSIKYLYNISNETSVFEYTPGTLPSGFNSSISVNLIGINSW